MRTCSNLRICSKHSILSFLINFFFQNFGKELSIADDFSLLPVGRDILKIHI